MKRLVIPVFFGLLFITCASGELGEQDWPQWAQNPQHTGLVRVEGQAPKQQLADIVYDPFVAQEQVEENGELLVHYQVPLVIKEHVYMEFKTGTWIPCSSPGSWVFGEACGPNTWNQQVWNEKALVWRGGNLATEWTFQSDWKAEPVGSPLIGAGGLAGWEPVFHAVVTGRFVYVPGFGGTVWKVNPENGKAVSQINPFGLTVDPNTFVSGPLSADDHGNVYYNAIKLIDPTLADPWGGSDVLGAWLVKVTPEDAAATVTYATLVPGRQQRSQLARESFSIRPRPHGHPARPPCQQASPAAHSGRPLM